MLIPFRACLHRPTLIFIRDLLKSIRSSLFSVVMDANDSGDVRSSHSPPPFDPSQPSLPVSYPIKTLEDLGSRSYFESFHYPFNKASVKLPSHSTSLPERPRILVCHDMDGGYLDDKWVQGGTNSDAYSIRQWYLIDVFVYFSHSLVTLPPPCWTNAAHKHGVKVLGTFITEWDEGKVIANTLLSTKESAQLYAACLTELAVKLDFDGWLLNMEVKLDVGQIPNLKEFISHLKETMHSSKPGSLVIWYDSVTVDGNLQWQDQLNGNNKPFFDICDGIYINYAWKEDYPKHSAAVAGDRKFDVYMGIDVFGRGTYGGGQWNTNVALDLLKKDAVSAAIFAPGWAYETNQQPDPQTAHNLWWALIGKSWGILQNYPRVLPFYSNFDQGHGFHFSVDGERVSSTPWNNISSQSFQPYLEDQGDSPSNAIQVFTGFKEASYCGGGNITFKGALKNNAYFTRRIFQGDIILGDLPVFFTYSVKSDGNSLLSISLKFSSILKESVSVLLASSGTLPATMSQFSSKFTEVIMASQITELETDPGWVMQESSIAMDGYKLTEINAVCYQSKPELSELRLQAESDTEDNVSSCTLSEYFAVLGHITIKTSKKSSDFPPSTSWLVDGEYVKWTLNSEGSRSLSVKVIWTLKYGDACLFPEYIIYVEKQANQAVGEPNRMTEVVAEYLGVAKINAFYVSDLLVPTGISSLKFIIQACSIDGVCQKLDDSPSFQLPVKG